MHYIFVLLQCLLVLLPAPLWALEITVSGQDSPFAESEESSTATRIIVRPSEGLDSAAAVAAQAGGVQVDASGAEGSWSAVSIRGATASQTELELEGIPLSGAGSSVLNLSLFDAALLRRVDVLRDAVAGSAAIGGLVRMYMASDNERPRFAVGCGSYQTCRGNAVIGAPLGSSHLTLGMSGFHTAGNYEYPSDNGTPLNAADDQVLAASNNNVDRYNLMGSWRMPLREGSALRLLGWGVYHRNGLMGRDLDQAARASFATRMVGLIQHWDRYLAPDLDLQQSLWVRVSDLHYDDRFGELGLGVPDVVTDLWEQGGSVQLNGHWSKPGLSFAFKTQGRLERSQAEDLQSGDKTSVSSRDSILGDATLNWRWWHRRGLVQAGLSGIWSHSVVDGLQPEQSGFSLKEVAPVTHTYLNPKVALRLRVYRELSVKASWNRGARLPSFLELFGNQGALVPNPELLPEQAQNWMVGMQYWMQGTHRLDMSLVLFHRQTKDQITFVQNSSNTARAENLARVQVRGLEWEHKLQLWPEKFVSLDWEGSFNLMEALDQGSEVAYAGKQIPRIPLWSTQQKIALEASGMGGIYRVFWLANLRDQVWRDRAERIRIPSVSQHNVGVSWLPQPSPVPVTLSLALRNLMNHTFYNYDRYPLPGRSIFLTLSFQ